jgi:hypothetical protein
MAGSTWRRSARREGEPGTVWATCTCDKHQGDLGADLPAYERPAFKVGTLGEECRLEQQQCGLTASALQASSAEQAFS